MKTATQEAISDFLAQRTFAVIGATREERLLGNVAFKTLRAKGYVLYLIHPSGETINGEPSYPSISSLPEAVDGVIVFTKPDKSESVVQEAINAGIKRIWLQHSSDSPEALKLCADNGISEVHGECILMFAEPVGFPHNVHRCVWRWLGKLPA